MNTPQSSISTLTITVTEITSQRIALTAMSETTSKMIEQTSHTTASISLFIITTA